MRSRADIDGSHYFVIYLCVIGAFLGAVAEQVVPRAVIAIDAAVAIKCFGVAASYLIVVGDQMPSIVFWFQDTLDCHLTNVC